VSAIDNYYFVSGDLLPVFSFKFRKEDAEGNITNDALSNYTAIKLRMRREDGVLIVVDHTVDDDAAGEGHFAWSAGDLATGTHKAEIVRSTATGDETLPSDQPMTFDVRDTV
jgi:hypothetical protein